MDTAVVEPKKALGVRATAEQRRIISEAAGLENRSISNFVLQAALQAAEARRSTAHPRRTQAEIHEILRRAQDAMRRANPTGRSLVDELTAERRAEAARE
jgi:hypothetical protein